MRRYCRKHLLRMSLQVLEIDQHYIRSRLQKVVHVTQAHRPLLQWIARDWVKFHHVGQLVYPVVKQAGFATQKLFLAVMYLTLPSALQFLVHFVRFLIRSGQPFVQRPNETNVQHPVVSGFLIRVAARVNCMLPWNVLLPSGVVFSQEAGWYVGRRGCVGIDITDAEMLREQM